MSMSHCRRCGDPTPYRAGRRGREPDMERPLCEACVDELADEARRVVAKEERVIRKEEER